MTDKVTASELHDEDKEISIETTRKDGDSAASTKSREHTPNTLGELPHTNGNHTVENGEELRQGGEGPPNKKRRISEHVPVTRERPVSPPWKSITAEGPSSFTENGMRKSGRTNAIPLDLQPQGGKRQTRGAQRNNTAKVKPTNSHNPYTSSRDTAFTNGHTRSASTYTKSPAKVAPSPKQSHKKPVVKEPPVPARSHKKKIPTTSSPNDTPNPARASHTRRSRGYSDIGRGEPLLRPPGLKSEDTNDRSPRSKLSRIRLKVKPAALPFPNHYLVRPRLPQYTSLEEFLEKGGETTTEEGGLFNAEEPDEYTSDSVLRDANLLLQIEAAAEPGGVLAPGRCSVYQPEKTVLPPKQFAHRDHLHAAAHNFRKLMIIEHRKHRANAKRLAELCRDEWVRRQPKSLEQIELEEIKASQNRYKVLVKAMQGTWDNVRVEINRRRFVEWEAEEKVRVRKRLNEAVDKSTQQLQARQARMDSEVASDDDEDRSQDEESNEEEDFSEMAQESQSSHSESQSGNDSDNLSESESEEETGDFTADENLTVDELRDKYADLPEETTRDEDIDVSMLDVDDSKTPEPEAGPDDMALDYEEDQDDSDESVDMDDDLGSSDEDRDSEDDESAEESDDPGESGLLGFLGPSDLKAISKTDDSIDDDVLAPEQDTVDETHDITDVDDRSADGKGESDVMHVDKLDTNDLQIGDDRQQEPLTTENLTISPDRSSQPTPPNTDTRVSEIDSATSVDHQASRQGSESVPPTSASNLKTPVPFLLRGTLREYQHYGLDWLANLYANNTNGILADEMGLGKTIQTIALLAHLACHHEVWGPHLVIVPTSVMLNWEMEFKKWCPGFKILTYYGNQEERRKKRQGWKADDHWNVCITSYQLILADQQVFKRRKWHYMILDEAHNIKNFQSQRWQTMLTFSTRARLLLTGTPLQNNLTELWSLLYFLMPSDGTDQGVGGFANLKEFQDWFKKPSEQILEHGRETMDDESRAIIAKLHKVLRPYLLRRLKADVEKQMPGKYEHVEWCRLSKRQRELYDGFLSRGDTRDTLASGNYLSIINCLMQLRKVCNHPDLFIERAIMTSFPMEKSAVADFEIKELLVRKRLRVLPMSQVSLEFLNLIPAKHERLSETATSRSSQLTASRFLMDLREAQRVRAQSAYTSLNTTSTQSNLVYLESASRWGRFEELQHCVYLNALRRQQKPVYGSKLVEFLTLNLDSHPLKKRPKRRSDMITWLENMSPTLSEMVLDLPTRSQRMQPFVSKFACLTPSVVAKDMTSRTLTAKGIEVIQNEVEPSVMDPFHEARMRLSIQFPDKRLLQYDCGKLQTLAKLLRRLQSGGHRVLIFTQMTKVLDILEQFLNIHGHKYLRLDGSTKIEQRQILTDRFNNDTRILAFILSTRSGGLGINLTGADTVIFYDLDWNPAMDKQCQDRCHRIGQTRDVHIYRLVSEHTIEANILRKANQKQMLDDVVIQEGDFTTDYFNKMSARSTQDTNTDLLDGDDVANAAMDRVLGGPGGNKDMQKVIAQAEDTEDVVAASIAEKEIVQTDAADFDENVTTQDATPAGGDTPLTGAPSASGAATPAITEVIEEEEDEPNAWGEKIKSTDEYMLSFMAEQLKNTPIELPKEKSRNRKGRDHRSHRAR